MNRVDSLCTILRRNGGYLVLLGSQCPGWDDLTIDEQVDAAGSLKRAKRVGIDLAEQMGCSGPFRWRLVKAGWWELSGHVDDD